MKELPRKSGKSSNLHETIHLFRQSAYIPRRWPVVLCLNFWAREERWFLEVRNGWLPSEETGSPRKGEAAKPRRNHTITKKSTSQASSSRVTRKKKTEIEGYSTDESVVWGRRVPSSSAGCHSFDPLLLPQIYLSVIKLFFFFFECCRAADGSRFSLPIPYIEVDQSESQEVADDCPS